MLVMPGSSPLTRGKHRRSARDRRGMGLIPAHAGKTTRAACRPRGTRAHPRSRGENISASCSAVSMLGSSPLTRGKLLPSFYPPVKRGLIPAHAGKTLLFSLSLLLFRAHPRSRGENGVTRVGDPLPWGSSPLTRGKRSLRGLHRGHERLIPAHAGKTSWSSRSSRASRAHPRSRGENTRTSYIGTFKCGSSPLTRGKPDALFELCLQCGLIPAHAGKTRGHP